MYNIDKTINKILNKARSNTTPNSVMNAKIKSVGELARSSVFFPFTQPTVKSPTGKIIKGRMPSVKNVMKNMGFKSIGGKNDWDGDGIVNKKDCQPRNTMRQDFKLKADTPMVDYPESYGYQKRTDYMSPDEYMKKAYASHGYHKSGFPTVQEYEKGNVFQSNVDRIKEGLRKKEKVVPAPWLETRQGIYEEQEGRHRAVAARQLGMEKIPVHIVETRPTSNLLSDKDKDGVNNMMDCCPEDAQQQGPGDLQPQSLFYAGSITPSQYLQQKGHVFGFSQLRFAEAWARKMNYPYVYQYQTNQYKIDEKRYIRDTVAGKEYNDNEFIAYNVLTQKLIGVQR